LLISQSTGQCYVDDSKSTTISDMHIITHSAFSYNIFSRASARDPKTLAL